MKAFGSCASAKEVISNHSASASMFDTPIILTGRFKMEMEKDSIALYLRSHTFSWDTCLFLRLAEEKIWITHYH